MPAPIPDEPYVALIVSPGDTLQIGGWQLKLQTVRRDGKPPVLDAAATAHLTELLRPLDLDDEYHGYGLVILHKGTTADYLTVVLWRNGVEMAILMAENHRSPSHWNQVPVVLCPWDARIIANDADEWRDRVLRGRGNPVGLEEYLRKVQDTTF